MKESLLEMFEAHRLTVSSIDVSCKWLKSGVSLQYTLQEKTVLGKSSHRLWNKHMYKNAMECDDHIETGGQL